MPAGAHRTRCYRALATKRLQEAPGRRPPAPLRTRLRAWSSNDLARARASPWSLRRLASRSFFAVKASLSCRSGDGMRSVLLPVTTRGPLTSPEMRKCLRYESRSTALTVAHHRDRSLRSRCLIGVSDDRNGPRVVTGQSAARIPAPERNDDGCVATRTEREARYSISFTTATPELAPSRSATTQEGGCPAWPEGAAQAPPGRRCASC